MSMAAGEYVSVRSQADTEEADLALERHELATDDTSERAELASIYVARGLEPALAQQVANQLMAHDALGAHARDELVSSISSGASRAGRCCFGGDLLVGGALPILVMLLAPASILAVAVVGLSLAFWRRSDGSRPALEALGPPSEPCASPSGASGDGAHLWRWRLVRGRRKASSTPLLLPPTLEAAGIRSSGRPSAHSCGLSEPARARSSHPRSPAGGEAPLAGAPMPQHGDTASLWKLVSARYRPESSTKWTGASVAPDRLVLASTWGAVRWQDRGGPESVSMTPRDHGEGEDGDLGRCLRPGEQFCSDFTAGRR